MSIDIIIKSVTEKLPDILLAVAIFFVFWLIGTILKTMAKKLLDEKSPHKNISRVISGIIKNIMLIIGFITALGTLGINVSAIVAGLGLTGFAFGFAFKDMLSNFISGILIFIYEPFKLGDTIEVEGKSCGENSITGKVIDINLRYVTIEGEDQLAHIPNSISVSKIVVVKK